LKISERKKRKRLNTEIAKGTEKREEEDGDDFAGE
jgi:hypothetical protein